jgi:hypothetical protein
VFLPALSFPQPRPPALAHPSDGPCALYAIHAVCGCMGVCVHACAACANVPMVYASISTLLHCSPHTRPALLWALSFGAALLLLAAALLLLPACGWPVQARHRPFLSIQFLIGPLGAGDRASFLRDSTRKTFVCFLNVRTS